MSVQPASERRTNRPYRMSELRAARDLYVSSLPVKEIAARLGRSPRSIHQALQHSDIPKRQPRRDLDTDRRDGKIVEAILCGDDIRTVMRRWGLTSAGLYQILYSHKRRTRMSTELWRKNFLSVMSGLS